MESIDDLRRRIAAEKAAERADLHRRAEDAARVNAQQARRHPFRVDVDEELQRFLSREFVPVLRQEKIKPYRCQYPQRFRRALGRDGQILYAWPLGSELYKSCVAVGSDSTLIMLQRIIEPTGRLRAPCIVATNGWPLGPMTLSSPSWDNVSITIHQSLLGNLERYLKGTHVCQGGGGITRPLSTPPDLI